MRAIRIFCATLLGTFLASCSPPSPEPLPRAVHVAIASSPDGPTYRVDDIVVPRERLAEATLNAAKIVHPDMSDAVALERALIMIEVRAADRGVGLREQMDLATNELRAFKRQELVMIAEPAGSPDN